MFSLLGVWSWVVEPLLNGCCQCLVGLTVRAAFGDLSFENGSSEFSTSIVSAVITGPSVARALLAVLSV